MDSDMNKRLNRNSNFEFDGDRNMISTVDWTQLPGDTVIHMLSLLNYRERANVSCVCPVWRSLASSDCLWRSLDLRWFNFNIPMAISLASRCSSLRKLYFHGGVNVEAINHLEARNLVELRGNLCRIVTDKLLTRIVDMHKLLEIIQLGSQICDAITSSGIGSIARCCPNLKKLWISGVMIVDSDALNALARNCKLLVDLSFTDCYKLDEIALSNLVSVQFLSIAGVKQLDSDLVLEHWIKFPSLLALDVSRTNISPAAVVKLLSYSPALKVLCALNCTAMEQHNFSFRRDSVEFISILTYIPKLLESQDPMILPWIEQVLSSSFHRLAESRPLEMQDFWFNQGVTMFINLLQSSQEDVQEITIFGLSKFLSREDTLHLSNLFIEKGVMTEFSNLAKSSNVGILFHMIKVISILLSNHVEVAYATAKGGIRILVNLLEFHKSIIVEKASEALRSLFMVIDDYYKIIIMECGGLKVLVNLLYKRIHKNTRSHIVFILGCMSFDIELSFEIIRSGGLKALAKATLENQLNDESELKIARALAKLTEFGKMNIIVEHESGLLQALIKLIRSRRRDGKSIRKLGVVALWNLSTDGRNHESIVAAKGIEALVFLANSTSSISWERWKSASEVEKNTSFVPQSCSNSDDDVHVDIIEALWNLAYMPDFALRVVDAKGIQTLIRLSLVSESKLARFLAVLVMAGIFHVIPEGCKYNRRTSSNQLPKILMTRMKHIEEFINKFLNNKTPGSASSASTFLTLDQIQEHSRINDVNEIKCSEADIARIVNMLQSSFSSIKSCAAFALMQFTTPGNKNTRHHISFLDDEETIAILRSTAKCSTGPFAAVTFSKIVLSNLEYPF